MNDVVKLVNGDLLVNPFDFNPTQQQINIVDASKVKRLLKIEASAGASKTSTCELVAHNSPEKKALYMAFNKAMAVEAEEKFPSETVDCMTTHSLAYRSFGHQLQHKLTRPRFTSFKDYVNVYGTGSEIARAFKIKSWKCPRFTQVSLPAGFQGELIKRQVALFESSADEFLRSHHFPMQMLFTKLKKYEKKLKAEDWKYVKDKIYNVFLPMITSYSEKLWEYRIDTSHVALATHDTYLKLYQLSKPDLSHYDLIFGDEFQDTTDCVLDIFMRQKDHCQLIMVGDSFQNIYQFRNAINALGRIEEDSYPLLKSFRFGPKVAGVAKMVLEGAIDITGNDSVDSQVLVNDTKKHKHYVKIFRGNATLLGEALELIQRGVEVSISIDVGDFCRKLESAVELKYGNMKKVKHPDIICYENYQDFCDDAEIDKELSRIKDFVEGGKVGEVIKALKSYKKPRNPTVTFITAHKSKGLEWDIVHLADDFPSVYDRDGNFKGFEDDCERNLLYVAVTRARKRLKVNQTIMELYEYHGNKWVDIDFLSEEDC
ncbi:F-box DNA helicase protein 1-like protein [Pseudoalteromonas phage J2-1_QLiu-2017]|nr:F-box DNA helicase protein 1-like protein [Pseudoalteromonas phage J2-1_QLiu-2017]